MIIIIIAQIEIVLVSVFSCADSITAASPHPPYRTNLLLFRSQLSHLFQLGALSFCARFPTAHPPDSAPRSHPVRPLA